MKSLAKVSAWIFIVLCFLVGYSQAEARMTLYTELEKETNGGYRAQLPALEWVGEYQNILLENELGLVFTAPRSSMGSMNHHSVDNNFSLGFQDILIPGSFITTSLGVRYLFEGNDDGLEEGFSWYNCFRAGIELP